LISTPEYAHGIPGALKNALDWLVGGNEFIDKPVTLLNASSRGAFAQSFLIEILRTMSGRVVLGAIRTVGLVGREVTFEDLTSDPTTREVIRDCLEAFSKAIAEG
jgi:chromate reductase, NAD(P)H dehydrogenase (quinone)